MTAPQRRRKVYVDVNADHMKDGTARSKKITFEDGIYEVDRISARCRATSRKVAGMGIREYARLHGVKHQSVFETTDAIRKKVKKFLS